MTRGAAFHMVRHRRFLVPTLVLVACALLLWPVSVAAAAPDDSSISATAPTWVQVPFIAQTEALCGGAAVAMVTHYWGSRDIQAQDFAPLIDDRADGIRADRLVGAVTDRGWSGWSLRGTPSFVRHHLERGRPLIALIEAGRGRLHYVVLVAWTDDRVVLHDPARGPHELVASDEFLGRWEASGFLTLLVLPRTEHRSEAAPRGAESSSACGDIVEPAITLAASGRVSDAEVLLQRATRVCPDAAAPWRELAGLRLRQSRADDARELAGLAVARDPGDEHGWRLLAVSRYLSGETVGALAAWNHVDEPRVDLVPIQGTAMRAGLVAGWVGLRGRDLLTPERLQHARRRLDLLPSVARARLSYRPRGSGQADVEVHIRDRPLVFGGVTDALWWTGRSVVEQHASVRVSSPTGGGEVWSAGWRWEPHRPRVAVGLAAPRPTGGVWRVNAVWEAHDFRPAGPTGGTLEREARRRVSFAVDDWLGSCCRWSAGAGFDDWRDRGSQISVDLGMGVRDVGDRRAVDVSTSVWLPLESSVSTFATWSVTAGWRRNRAVGDGTDVRARIGGGGVAGPAPLTVWPRADTGRAGSLPLRAHPALDDGIVRGDRLGRTLVGAGVEVERRVVRLPLADVAMVAFADAAQTWAAHDRRTEAPSLLIDVGFGLRIDPWTGDRRLRLDVARGLRHGGTVVSIGWSTPWPGW